MAEVEISNRVITPAVPAVIEKSYVLTLTEDEARAVWALSGVVSGKSYFRDQTNRVYNTMSLVFDEPGHKNPAYVDLSLNDYESLVPNGSWKGSNG